MTTFLVVALFSLVLISWPQDVTDYITGAAEVFTNNGVGSSDRFTKYGRDSSVFSPSEELLKEREKAYDEITVIGSGGMSASEYYGIRDKGIKVSYSPEEGKQINVYDPNGELVKEVEASEEIYGIELDYVEIGVYKIEEKLNGVVLSKDYFSISPPEIELSKEDIEVMYKIKEVDILEQHNIDKEISSVLFGKLAKANVIGKTVVDEDIGRVREILEFNKYHNSIFDSVKILDKGKDIVSFAPKKELQKTFVRKLEYPGIEFSPGENPLGRFGIYFSGKEDSGDEFSIVDVLVRNGKPKINLGF